MNTTDFNTLVDARIEKIRATLKKKAGEYAQNDDRLYNFRKAAAVDGETPARALWGMAKKHLVSVMDLKDGLLPSTPEMVDEKIGDMINYLILLEAVLLEGKI
jgi:hypothetical protein